MYFLLEMGIYIQLCYIATESIADNFFSAAYQFMQSNTLNQICFLHTFK